MEDNASTAFVPERFLVVLIRQPTEIIGEVLQWLELKHLLILRITDRRFHYLIHRHEQSICTRFCGRLRRQNRALQLPVKIHGLTNDLLYYVELQRRYLIIRELSLLLCTKIVSKIRTHHINPDEATMAEWRSRKRSMLNSKLFPSLFILNNFLECLRPVFVKGEEAFALWDEDVLLALHDVYDMDQQRIIEDMNPCNASTIHDVTAAFLILCGVAKSRKLSLSSKSPKYPFCSLKKILVYSGLQPVLGILEESTSEEPPRNKLIEPGENLWHEQGRKAVQHHGPILRSICHLETDRVPSVANLTVNRCHRPKNWFIDRQDVWTKAAFAVIQRLGSTASFPPDPNDWIRHTIAEAYDPIYVIDDWKAPQ
jgi:hypothetical protein